MLSSKVNQGIDATTKQFMINARKYLNSMEHIELNVPPNILQQFTGDWYGLMASQSVNKDYWFISMLISGYSSPAEFDGINSTVLIPDRAKIDELLTKLKVQAKSGNY